jgi:DMSO/TMAO reductase YedYZ heme-binding membrane subunit
MSHALPSAAAPARARRSLGPWIALAIAVGLAGGLAAVAIGHGAESAETNGRVLAARYTARFAFLLFLPVYLASSWHRLARSAASRWTMLHRRALGLGFASAHGVHLAALLAAVRASGEPMALSTAVVGGGAYVMTFAMAATSNDASVRALGRHWKTLHRIGIHWIWFVFMFSYGGRVAGGRTFFLPFAGAALGALAIRILSHRAQRRKSAAS